MNKVYIIVFSISIILLIYLLYKYYWKIQLHFNNSGVSFYTPDSFVFKDEKSREKFDIYMKYGFNKMKQRTVVICSLLRDVEKEIPYIIKKSERVGKMFKDYKILIVENDSKDNTRQLLLGWSHINPNVIILGCGVGVEKCELNMKKTEGHSVTEWRIQKMVNLRNEYMKFMKHYLYNYDYCIIWDLDVIGNVYLDGIANTIGYMEYSVMHDNKSIIDTNRRGVKNTLPNIDAVCANGIYKFGNLDFMYFYYDTYAHLNKGDIYHINDHLAHNISKRFGCRYDFGDDLVSVMSCFSGFTIYKIPSIVNLEYKMSEDGSVECEHVSINKKLKNVYVNPSMIYRLLVNE